MNNSLINTIEEKFYTQFETKPQLAFAPGRINVIGEHTDYNEGFVFPAAINLGVGVAIQKCENFNCQIISLDMNESLRFDISKDLKPITSGSWKNYILGIIIELKKKSYQLQGFNMVFGGDIPIGSGLSSSAALENAFLIAINELQQLNLDKFEMIHIAQKAEHNAVGVKCGIMDQYSSMFGKKGQALFLDCNTITSEAVPLHLDNYEILLINSNVKHSLAENAYNERREACERVNKALNIPSLRYLTIETLEENKHKLNTDDYIKALYVINENRRVENSVAVLKQQNIKALGELLFESHQGMKNRYQITCPELDFLVDFAYQHPDVIGARMMGGGFGGCTINIVKKGKSKSFFNEVSKQFQNTFKTLCTAIPITIENGAQLIKTNVTNAISTRTIS